jgi:hypothetical protein
MPAKAPDMPPFAPSIEFRSPLRKRPMKSLRMEERTSAMLC